METKRQLKISRLLQKDLGEVIQIINRNELPNCLITVTKVNITPDLSVAKVFLSIFTPNDKFQTLNIIENKKNEIRKELGNRVKNQLRIVPSIEFRIDDSLDYIANIEELLKH